MITVRRLLDRKGYQIWSITPDASVHEAVEEMTNRDVGSLMVVEGEKLVGILSERDCARKVILPGKAGQAVAVGDIMTESVYYVRPDQTIDDCMALMTEKRIRHLPVLDEERLVGVISIGDAVKAVIDQKDFRIEQLENYITGRGR